MPWQQLVADVGLELDPDTGLPAYREVIMTVPRQSGKTILILAWEIQRARGWPAMGEGPQRVVYSAQKGNDARKKLIEDQVPILDRASVKKALGIKTILQGMGNEAVVFNNGSRIVLLASAEDSGHGKTVDLGVKDEFWADFDDRRDQALVPAMNTRPAAQTLTASTAGTDESIPLNRAIKRGRSAVESGVRSGIAYFEWSAPEDADPDDEDLWWSYMPALGHTIGVAAVRHARSTLSDGEFRRAYMNQTTRAEERVISQAAWDSVMSSVGPEGPLSFAVDVNPDRTFASIAAASGGSVPRAELVHHGDGVGWIPDIARQVAERNGSGRPWYVASPGPAASLIPDLEAEGLTVVGVSASDFVAACGSFYDRVIEGRCQLHPHPALNTAAAGASKRSSGDAWAWARKHPSVDVSPLVAVTLATWGATAGAPVDDGPSVYEERGLTVLG